MYKTNIFLIFIFIVFVQFSCENNKNHNKNRFAKKNENVQLNKQVSDSQFYWKGTLNSGSNFFLTFKKSEDFIYGVITMKKQSKAIVNQIIGTKDEDGKYRIIVFDTFGMITDILISLYIENEFSGKWFETSSNKEMEFISKKVDTSVNLEELNTDINNIVADYHYQYGNNGTRGDIIIKKVKNKKISITIGSFLNNYSNNYAELKIDSIEKMTTIYYNIPDSDSCQIRLKFFKKFAWITYKTKNCKGIFGQNTTLEGIYIKNDLN